MDKSLILKKIKIFYNIKTDAEFARFLGITTQNMYTWIKRNTYDPSTILAKCPDIRAEWLLNGEGEMLKNTFSQLNNSVSGNNNILAGGNGNITIGKLNECEREVEILKVTVEHLSDKLKEKDKMIEEKDKMIEEKERMISILMNK